MTKFSSTCLCALICFVLLSICQIVPAQDVKSKETGTTDPNRVLQDLVAEVHELRQALERATTTASRAEILLQRAHIVQSKIDNLNGQLFLVRSKIIEEISTQAPLIRNLSGCEAAQASHPTLDCTGHQENMDTAKQKEQRLREQESQITSQLQIEQGKLDELNDRLDKLDRELQEAQPVNKTPPKKNP